MLWRCPIVPCKTKSHPNCPSRLRAMGVMVMRRPAPFAKNLVHLAGLNNMALFL